MTAVERVESIKSSIVKYEANPLLELYGEELGTAKLVRDGRDFRVFSKYLETAKSGKADLVELHVFISVDGKPFALVRGVTYLPKFVLENKDVYWILENKIHNVLTDDPEYGSITISCQYIPRKYTARMYAWSQAFTSTPEIRTVEHLNFLKCFLRQSEVEAFPLVVVA